jgi:hypothetical protein
MDKRSKAPGVYRAILCVLTLALAPVFYAIWQPYHTCLLQLPAAGGVWQLLTRLLYYVLFSLLLAGICRSSLGPKTVAPFGAKSWLRTVGGVLAARLVLDLVIYGGSFLLPVDLVRQSGQLAFLLFAFLWAARCAGLTAAVGKGSRVWVALMGILTVGVWLALLLYGRGVTAAYGKQAVWLVQDMVTGVLLYGVLCARFSLRRGNWTTGFRGFCIFVLRFEAVLLVAVFLCVAKVMVLPQGAVQSVNSVNMVDSSVTRVERMAGYADLLNLFRESNGVEDLF